MSAHFLKRSKDGAFGMLKRKKSEDSGGRKPSNGSIIYKLLCISEEHLPRGSKPLSLPTI